MADLKALEEKIRELIEAASEDVYELEMRVEQEGTTVKICAQDMYGFVPLTYEMMRAASEALGTAAISEERYVEGGCDTCDYGSTYEWTLICKEVTR